ncbi:50S ribosomal protein L6 [Candidatus Uhrbacteria bacterium]|nr:50S ribosomal protein L6 [Candidatus Uhrbacteria bacterium]
MSRIGKQPITVPGGVDVNIDGSVVAIKGPKGSLQRTLHSAVTIGKDGSTLHVTVGDPQNNTHKALWGLSQRLVSNMVNGVTKGFEKQLELNGVGFRASLSGRALTLNVGFSHAVEFSLPLGIEAKVEKNVITLSGIDKELVGQTAASIRKIRKPEPYKGKGIRYVGEVVRKKAGKAAKAGAK